VQRIGIDFEADEDTPPTVSARVAVLPADQRRASELLGFADPADAVVAKPTMPVGRVLLIFAVAMVVIPGLAFWLSYNFS
jgi:hypothetical protein